MGASSGGGGMGSQSDRASQLGMGTRGSGTVSGWSQSLSGSGQSAYGSGSRASSGGPSAGERALTQAAANRAAGRPSGLNTASSQSAGERALVSAASSGVNPREQAGAGSPGQTALVNQVQQSSAAPIDTSPVLRLTPQGLLLTPNNDPQTSEGVRLGDNQGGDQGQGQTPAPPAAKPEAPTPPSQPSPPAAQPRQRAAALQRGPAVEEPRTLLTLSLADVTRKSLLGV